MNSVTSTPLLNAFDQQEELFSSAFSILTDAISNRAFPGAAVAVMQRDGLVAHKSLGRFTYEPDSPLVTNATLFDVASVTKAVATTTMAMLLYERGLLELKAPVVGVVPQFMADACGEPDARRRDVTFHMLLAHSSGLPGYEKLFLKAHTREDLLRAAFTTSLSTDPGTRAEYSDIGFIILGAALEHIAGEPLNVFCQREIFGPLAMINSTFNPPIDTRRQIPPTADERVEAQCGAGAAARERPTGKSVPEVSDPARSSFRQRINQGEVQDENASVLGGVAGHAGLFSAAEDLARFAHTMLRAGSPILRRETVELFTRRELAPPETSRALGWDTPTAPSQSGKYFGARSFGHLGYTGTSLWIDPDRQLSIILLTNRTWPECANQAIRQVRPRFHDAIADAVHK
jgi:CubicO group peptidase (beta-lactamase class C family)